MIREALTIQRLRSMEPREAAAYFVARREEGFTPSEHDLLAEWLAEDPAHARELRNAEQAWNWFAGADDHEVLGAMRARAVQPRRRSWISRPQAAAAAAILVLFGAGALLIMILNGPAPVGTVGNGTNASVQYASAVGEVRQIALPDGSAMTLDARSLAVARFGASERSVRLVRGRAFFDVRPDPARPFSVGVADRRVVAVGTRFDVELAAGALTVNLVEGRVLVGPVGGGVQPVTLKPGQQLVERSGIARIRNVGARMEEETGWRTGLLHFNDVTLGEALGEVNRYSRVQISTRDPAVAAMRVSGVFRAGAPERFVQTIGELRPVRSVRRTNEIELVLAN